MTTREIYNFQKEIQGLLSEQRLHDAFERIRNLSDGLMIWEITDRSKRLEENYAYMLKYLAEGADDPQRDRLLSELVDDVYILTDELVTTLMSRDTPTLYYNILRYNRQTGKHLSEVLENYEKAVDDSSRVDTFVGSSSVESDNELFNSVWTAFPLKKGDVEIIKRLLHNEWIALHSRRLLLSALTLGALEFFDKAKLELLIEVYIGNAGSQSSEANILASVAMVGITMVLLKYNDRRLPSTTLDKLSVARDMNTWQSDLRQVILELIRTRDTERINRTMRDEIIPGMMALRPEIEKKLKDGDLPLEELDGMQMNPEWEDILDKSGISDKLKELNEMQMEGSDVFMSTFAHLKNFPFFKDVSSWFMPFSIQTGTIEKITAKDSAMAEVAALIENLPFLCDSDKYSMMLSIDMVPAAQRSMMLGQIEAQREQMADMTASIMSETLPLQRRREMRNYMQSVYRFYNLFRRKSEFFNVFDPNINPLDIKVLHNDICQAELLNLIAEFFFKRGYWADALTAYKALDLLNEFSAVVYQKMGYCYEMTGRLKEAVEAYEQADLLDSSSLWLKKRLAKVYRATGRLNDAVRAYKSLVESRPDDTGLAMSLGYTLIQAEKFNEALNQFYKVEFMDEHNRKILRPIAWCLFMTRQFDKASSYYDRILLDAPGSEDYLNMGHVSLARGQFREAINYYKLSVLNGDNSRDTFFKSLETDRRALAFVGIDSNSISLVADAMLYTLLGKS